MTQAVRTQTHPFGQGGALNTLTEIADLASELADPNPVTSRVQVWTRSRNRAVRTHTVTLPGLLAQLYESVIPSGGAGDGGVAGHTGSRPPLALEALSRHAEITLAVAGWCWKLRVDQRDTVQANIRALVGAASQLDHDAQERLRSDLRRWRSWAATMTGWEQITRLDRVPCPVCETHGSLRINLTTRTAYCANPDRDADGLRTCGATWAEDSIGVLAEYIKTITEGRAA